MHDGFSSGLTQVTIDVQTRGQALAMAGWSTEPTGLRPDVIWLHANGFNARTYRSALAPLAPALQVLAVDQRGHGGTPQAALTEGKQDALDMRDDLLGLLRVVSPDRPVILAGHSLGGCVALLAAAEAAARVRAVAVFEPVILSPEGAAAAIAAGGVVASEFHLVEKSRRRRRRFASRAEALASYRQRAAFATWPPAALEDYVEAGFRDLPTSEVELACAPEWEAANFAAHGHDIWDAMSRIEAPVWIYRAGVGSTCSITTADGFPRPAGQAEVHTVPGATHFLPIERPELVREVLLRVAAAAPT